MSADGFHTFRSRAAGTMPEVLLLDLDGVVFEGSRPIPGAVRADAAARRAGSAVRYVTNNASRTPAEVAEKLVGLGVAAGSGDVVTSAVVAVDVLVDWREQGLVDRRPVAVVGGRGLYEPLAAAGFDARPARDARPGECAVLVQGFTPDLGWADLAGASYLVAAGIPWIATNLDPTIPTGAGLAPGNGTLVGTVTVATGRRPDAVAGKPDPVMARRALGTGAAPAQGERAPVLVGDRLDTDIACGRAAGLATMLVLSGVHQFADLLAAPPEQRPDLVGADLWSLLDHHPQALAERPGHGTCRDVAATVTLTGEVEVAVDGPGADPLDVMRALAVAVWSLADANPGAAADLAVRVAAHPASHAARAPRTREPVDNGAAG